MDTVRLLAFYLPQFHPIPENDAWWGPGFTEWNNVARARPLFRGHEQPNLPADLGFYDLRLAETRRAQADLAREYGIHGFCYYHYWFGGKRLLDRPFDEVLASGEPDFPFALCWANEPWTRAWDGRSGETLLAQHYSADDDREHIRWLARAFADPRYIRVENKPFFAVYRASLLPDPQRTLTIWREEARALGIGELFLCRVESLITERGDPRPLGFDAAIEFQPDWHELNQMQPVRRTRFQRVLTRFGLNRSVFQQHRVFSYANVLAQMLRKPPVAYPRFPCVAPGWDNSPRRKTDAGIIVDSSPEQYEHWLRETIARFDPPAPEQNFVFVNAWNEWAEGAFLEPCERWGRAYLQATKRALEGVERVKENDKMTR